MNWTSIKNRSTIYYLIYGGGYSTPVFSYYDVLHNSRFPSSGTYGFKDMFDFTTLRLII